MAISSNYDFGTTLNRTSIIEAAFQIVAGPTVPPTSADYDKCSVFLNLRLNAFQSKGLNLRYTERKTITLVTDQIEYTTDADTIDIVPKSAYVSTVGTPVLDTPVEIISRDEYMVIPTKTTRSKPSRMYVEKGQTVKILIWPVADASQYSTITYSRIRIIRNMDAPGVTADVHGKQLLALVYALASDLCLVYPGNLEKAEFISAKADKLLEDCLGNDQEPLGSSQFSPIVPRIR